MEDKIYSAGYYGTSLCADCIHKYINNGEGIIGCRAFPNGIPDEARLGHNHSHILPGQTGEYVFTKADYDDLTPIGQYFWNIRHK